jgi:hypothetical protein
MPTSCGGNARKVRDANRPDTPCRDQRQWPAPRPRRAERRRPRLHCARIRPSGRDASLVRILRAPRRARPPPARNPLQKSSQIVLSSRSPHSLQVPELFAQHNRARLYLPTKSAARKKAAHTERCERTVCSRTHAARRPCGRAPISIRSTGAISAARDAKDSARKIRRRDSPAPLRAGLGGGGILLPRFARAIPLSRGQEEQDKGRDNCCQARARQRLASAADEPAPAESTGPPKHEIARGAGGSSSGSTPACRSVLR